MLNTFCLTVMTAIGQVGAEPSPAPQAPPALEAPVFRASPPAPGRSVITVESPLSAPPPSAQPVFQATPKDAVPEEAKKNGNGEEKKDGSGEENKEEEKKEPTKYAFMKLLECTPHGACMAQKGWSVLGWTQMSFTASTAERSNLPVTFNDWANRFQMNQNFVRIDKAIDAEKKEFQLGGRVEAILPGTDARFTIPRGLFDSQLRNGWDGGPRDYPVDIYQFYLEAYLPGVGQGTNVRVGRFATHIGYELVQGAETPFLSRPYLFQYNPFTHTGVWATTQLNDDWSVGYGLALGADNFIDPASRPTFLGQVKWAPKEGKTTVLFNTMITDPSYDVEEDFAFYNVYELQVIHKFNDKFTYVFDTIFSHIDNVPDLGGAQWWGVANYFLYQHTEKVASNLRVEFFDDVQGFRTGSEGLYFETIYGVTWTPKDWLMVRPFARYDHNFDSGAFEGKRNLFTAGIDCILRW